MSYDRWKLAFTTQIICSLLVGLCVILTWGTWFATLWSGVLIFFLLVVLASAVNRPDMLWNVLVTTYSPDESTAVTEVAVKSFESKKAAQEYAHKWGCTYEGFAVAEGRAKEKEKKND